MINFAISMLAVVITYALIRMALHIARQASVVPDDDGENEWRAMNAAAYKYELDRCCAFSHWYLTYDHDIDMIHRVLDAKEYHNAMMNYHYKQSLGIKCEHPKMPYYRF